MMAVKKSTRKIIVIVGATLSLLMVALLVPNNTLRQYLNIMIITSAIVASMVTMGWAKVRNEKTGFVRILIILTAVVFQLVYFTFLGMKLGFVGNVYRLSWVSLGTVFLPAILLIISEEILRGQLITRGKNSRLVLIWVTALMVAIEMIVVLPTYDLGVAKSWFDLSMVIMLPSVLKNILLTYVAYYYEYWLNIVFRLVMEMPMLVLPIWPDANEYLMVLFQTIPIMMLLLYLISIRWQHGAKERVQTARRQLQRPHTANEMKLYRSLRIGIASVAILAVAAYVALASGLFKYHLLAIGSGSMEPNISRGDMVFVEKTKNFGHMGEGDVLVFRHSNVTIIHRIDDVREENGVYTFITKGDANENVDTWVVDQGDVIGLAKGKIAMFGFPTLWLNELFNKD